MAKKQASSAPQRVTFLQFLKEREQLINLLFIGGAFLIIGIAFYLLHPYPEFTADSGDYLLSAKTKRIGGYRPIGYSWFLSFFHGFSETTTGFYVGQYLLHALATTVFLMSIKYFFAPQKKWFFYGFCILVIASPSAIYMTNYIMSDTIFNTMTLFWITTGLWVNKSENKFINTSIIILHIICLYLAFNVRYTGIFYPLISALWFIWSAKNRMIGFALAFLPLLVGITIYNSTKKTMAETLGINTFSGFSGWALANNASAIIPYIDLKPEEIRDRENKFVHSIVVQFPDSVFDQKQIIRTAFMWDNKFPGKQVLYRVKQSSQLGYVQSWVKTGQMLGNYAKFLIKKYPGKFFKHFLWMNIKQIFVPFDYPRLRNYKPEKQQKEWFHLDFEEKPRTIHFMGAIQPITNIGHYISWILFILTVLFVAIKFKWLNMNEEQKKILFFILAFSAGFLGLSVLSHPINNFRYLTPMHIPHMFLFFMVGNLVWKKVSEKAKVESSNS